MGSGGLLRAVKGWFTAPRIVTPEGVEALATEAAAQLAHKATVGYCQIKAGMSHRTLFSDPEFMTELERCRWQSFAAILSDFALLVDGLLRTAGGARNEDLRVWLCAFYAATLAPGPGRGGQGDMTTAQEASFAARLTAAQQGPPRRAADFGQESAEVVFNTLPFHPSVARLDFGMLLGMIRFGTVAFADTLHQRTDTAAVIAALCQRVPSRSRPKAGTAQE